MPRIFVLPQMDGDQPFELNDQFVLVGREPDNKLQIEDRNISKHHALLIKSDDTYRVFDLHSSNGTYVNDQPVTTVLLKAGDVLRFGDATFRYELSPARRKVGLQAGPVVLPTEIKEPAAAPAPAPLPPAAPGVGVRPALGGPVAAGPVAPKPVAPPPVPSAPAPAVVLPPPPASMKRPALGRPLVAAKPPVPVVPSAPAPAAAPMPPPITPQKPPSTPIATVTPPPTAVLPPKDEPKVKVAIPHVGARPLTAKPLVPAAPVVRDAKETQDAAPLMHAAAAAAQPTAAPAAPPVGEQPAAKPRGLGGLKPPGGAASGGLRLKLKP